MNTFLSSLLAGDSFRFKPSAVRLLFSRGISQIGPNDAFNFLLVRESDRAFKIYSKSSNTTLHLALIEEYEVEKIAS